MKSIMDHILNRIGGWFDNYFIKLLHLALKYYNFRFPHGNHYVNLVVRPKTNRINYRNKIKTQLNDVCIIIQGPLDNIDFVLQSIQLYRRYYPDTTVIVSSWLKYKKAHKVRILSAGGTPVFSREPILAGQLNINMQIVSTRVALKLAQRMRCTYVVKSRSDQRFYNPNAIEYLSWLSREFITGSKAPRERILIPGFNTTRYRYGSFGDMFQFGHINDLVSYWGLALDCRTGDLRGDAKKNGKYSLEYSAQIEITEAYLGRNYMKLLGVDAFPDLNAYWKCLAENFVVFDHTAIDLYWNKYQSIDNFISETPAFRKDRMYEKIDFTEWLLMQSNKITFHDSEKERQKKIR